MCELQISLTTASIEATFHGRWGVWLSDTGWWWATRTEALTSAELAAGCTPYLHADNSEELSERMRQQDHLARSAADAPGSARPTRGADRT
jgi:hypothetical protein